MFDVAWEPTTRAVFDTILGAHQDKFCVHGTITRHDNEAELQELMTAWGFKDAAVPLIKSHLRDAKWSYWICGNVYTLEET